MNKSLDYTSAQIYVITSLLNKDTRDIVLANHIGPEWFDNRYSAVATAAIENPDNWQYSLGMDYKEEVVAVLNASGHTANYDYWLKELGRCHRLNETIRLVEAVDSKIKLGEPHTDLIEELSAVKDIGQILAEDVDYLEEYTAAFHTKKTVLPTGYNQIDTTAPIIKGEYVVIAGRPSAGKTSFIVGCMTNFIINGRKTLYFALDDPIHYTLDKFHCIGRGLTQQQARGDKEGAANYFKMLEAMPLHIAPQQIIGLEDIISYCKNYKVNNPDLEVIVIDHLTKINAKGNSAYERTTKITSEIFSLTKQLGVTVMAVSQLNRSSEKEDRKMKMSDLRDSGAIEQDATKIFGFYLPEGKESPDGQPLMEWQVNCDVLKNKSGGTGTSFYTFCGPKYSFTEQ